MESTYNPILHVEDDENDIVLVRRALAAAAISHPLQSVRNGARAINYLLGQNPFDKHEFYPPPSLILLDLDLPLLSGLEFLKWRQTQPIIQRIPVIVLTASQKPSDITAAYEAGVNSYLTKPLTFEGLVDMLKAIRLFWLTQNTFATLPEKAGELKIGALLAGKEPLEISAISV